MLVDAAIGEGQKRNMARLFYRHRNKALVFGTCAGLAARAQAAFFSDVLAEKVNFFVINGQGFIGAKLAELGSCKELAFTALMAIAQGRVG